MKHIVFSVLLALCLFGCGEKKASPIQADSPTAGLNGTVLDVNGNPISGVGFHYVFHQTFTPFTSAIVKGATPLATIGVSYIVPTPSFVVVRILRLNTRDTITVQVNAIQPAGTYNLLIDANAITNGFYIRLLS